MNTLGQERSLPIDDDVIFSDFRGTRKPRIEKRQRKLLGRLDALHDFMRDDEQILLVTHALSPTPLLEQLTTGAVFVYIKRCLLVFTNQRILHLPTTMSYRYRQSIAELNYADMQWLTMKGSVLKAGFEKRHVEKFLYVARRERRKIKALIETLPVGGEGASSARFRTHLCPRCTAPLEPDRYECPQCRLAFKSKSTATKLSMLIPGGGYFYTGHWFLGISDALVELLIIAALVVSVLEWAGGNSESFVAVIIFGIFLAVEKTVTIYHARFFVDEYMPKDRQIKALGTVG